MTAGHDRPTYLFQQYLLKEPIKRGTWKSITNKKHLALAFEDNKTVCFITNRHASAAAKNSKQMFSLYSDIYFLAEDGETKPAVVLDWNLFCHYVDTFDQLVSDYDYPYRILKVNRKSTSC